MVSLKIISLIQVVMIALFIFISCSQQEEYEMQLPFPKTEKTILIASDLHWQHKDSNLRTTYLNEITEAFIYDVSLSNIDTLILTGDLTNNGRFVEHGEFITFLKRIEKNGTEVFVTMGNHDIGKEADPSMLKMMYADFGFAGALSYDEDSMSYLTKLDNEMWLLSLDLNVYGNKTSTMAATISDNTLIWVESCLERALQEGVMVLPFSHHNLIEHTMPGYERHYNIDKGSDLHKLLLKYNVPAYFSGHRHRSFIVDGSDKKRKLIELVMGTTMTYPNEYGMITYSGDRTLAYIDLKIDVDRWAEKNNLDNKELLYFSIYEKERAENATRENITNVVKELTSDVEEQKLLIDYYIEVTGHFKNKTLHETHESLRNRKELAMWKAYSNDVIFSRWLPWILENHTEDKKEHKIAF